MQNVTGKIKKKKHPDLKAKMLISNNCFSFNTKITMTTIQKFTKNLNILTPSKTRFKSKVT